VQALHLSNGDTINQKLAAKDGTVTRWLESTPSPTDLVESAFLTCLSRPPSPREMQGYLDIFNAADPKEKRAVLEDLLWSLLTCREFLFQH
jgi:hypothetical protein